MVMVNRGCVPVVVASITIAGRVGLCGDRVVWRWTMGSGGAGACDGFAVGRIDRAVGWCWWSWPLIVVFVWSAFIKVGLTSSLISVMMHVRHDNQW
jgi:hypothetical protein